MTEKGSVSTLGLPDDEVHLWIANPEGPDLPAVLRSWRHLLSGSEKERSAKFLSQRARDYFLLTRAMVRIILSRYSNTDPQDWTFTANRFGRPQIQGPVSTKIRFNISHTDGMIVCAVRKTCDVGVDVENLARITEALELAGRFFTASEVDQLKTASAEHLNRYFLRLWTLKEAFVKAIGHGLSTPLNSCSFDIMGWPEIVFSTNNTTYERSRWLFYVREPSVSHVLSVALSCKADQHPKLRAMPFLVHPM
jgi:4'-phosphopantetheinyl transferase